MSFTIRKATINDSLVLFEMVKVHHKEINLRKKPFANSISGFIKECFEKKSKIYYHVAVFKGNIIGYSAFIFSYDIFTGESIYIKEIYIKNEYRNIGVASFLFNNIVDIAKENNSYLINCIIDISNTERVSLLKKNNFTILDDLLLLNIFRNDIELYLDTVSTVVFPTVRFVKPYELHDLHELIGELTLEMKKEQHVDLYQLMKDGFANNPKFKVLVALNNDEVVGFTSFYETYNTYIGKYINVDKVYVKNEYQKQKYGLALMTNIFKYAHTNGFEKLETTLSKFDIEIIEQLKEFGIFPYDNLRVAELNNDDFSSILND